MWIKPVALTPLLALALLAQAPSLSRMEELIETGRYVQLRETAESALDAGDSSPEAWYALGMALLRGEGLLSRARLCLGRASELLERDGIEGDRVMLYDRTIMAQAEVARLMDRYQEQIELLRKHERAFGPSRRVEAGWPLMKLGRIEEARRLMLDIARLDSLGDASVAMNTLGSIEVEQDNPAAGYRWYQQALLHGPSVAVYCNLAETAVALGRFEEAERILIGTAREGALEIANPWSALTRIYTLEGRLVEAASAAREMMARNARIGAWAAEQKWSGLNHTAAELMLAASRDAEALRLTQLLLNRPDRHGTDSGHRYRSEAALLALRHEALRMERERLGEQASWSGMRERVVLFFRRLAVSFEMWRLRRRTASLLADNCGIDASVIPYGVEAPLPEWLRPPAGESFGAPIEAGARRRRAHVAGERPYHLLRTGEMELARGRANEALESLRSATAELPGAEVLLRARAQALEGRALEMSGQAGAAAARYQAALEKDPRVFRALSLGVPVAIETDGDARSREAAEMFAVSPRFRQGSGFRLVVAAAGQVLSARLESDLGAVLAEANSATGPAELCRKLHETAFAPRLDLTQTDWRSLDGSNESSSGDRLRNLGTPAR